MNTNATRGGFTDDLNPFGKPTLLWHGDDDQIVPMGASANTAKRLVPNSVLEVYPGAPNGLADTHKQQFNADLLGFLRG